MPSAADLPFLIRLLDDQDPAVQPVIEQQFSEFGGDISQDLAALGIQISGAEQRRLKKFLEPGRRATLRDEWLIPSGGAVSLEDDWESFESILRQLSDFLHDGITLRPSLPDSLDILADEIRESLPAPSADELRVWLFEEVSFRGVRAKADAEKNFDLCRVIETKQGNPTSLAFLYILLARRLGAQVEGCNYPGHFLTKIQSEGKGYLVDCFHGGRSFEVEALLTAHSEISEKARTAVSVPSHLGVILVRYITELHHTLAGAGRTEDAKLFKELLSTL